MIYTFILNNISPRSTFYYHQPSWCCSLWLCNCVWLRSVGGRPYPCTCWNFCLLMTDVLARERVVVVAPIGNLALLAVGGHFDRTDCSELLCWYESFPKHQYNWSTVCGATQDLHNIFLLTICWGLERTSPCWFDVMYLPRSSVSKTTINLSLIFNTCLLMTSSRWLIFGGPVIAIRLSGKVKAN